MVKRLNIGCGCWIALLLFVLFVLFVAATLYLLVGNY